MKAATAKPGVGPRRAALALLAALVLWPDDAPAPPMPPECPRCFIDADAGADAGAGNDAEAPRDASDAMMDATDGSWTTVDATTGGSGALEEADVGCACVGARDGAGPGLGALLLGVGLFLLRSRRFTSRSSR
jgi:MYXO-CTERM domain-containing protein